MPSRKLTAQKRDEVQAKKEKIARRGYPEKKDSKTPMILVTLIIIIVIAAGIYFAFGNKPADVVDDDNDIVTNKDPVATQDFIVVGKNVAQSIIDFQANDIDPDGDMFNVTNLGDPTNGIFETIENETYFTPTENITGIETIDYTIDDGNGGSDSSKIHIIVVDLGVNPIAVMDTSMGIIVLEMYEDKQPITAGNFIDHANSGYYDGVIFHRVINDFMIQSGDPLGLGSGGHAAKYHEGFGTQDNPDSWAIPDEFHDDLSNIRGTISMANSGPNTGGSQFFINVVDNVYLDHNKYLNQETGEIVYEEVSYPQDSSKHAVFGNVIIGMDVVDSISEVQTSGSNKPTTDIVINTVVIGNN